LDLTNPTLTKEPAIEAEKIHCFQKNYYVLNSGLKTLWIPTQSTISRDFWDFPQYQACGKTKRLLFFFFKKVFFASTPKCNLIRVSS